MLCLGLSKECLIRKLHVSFSYDGRLTREFSIFQNSGGALQYWFNQRSLLVNRGEWIWNVTNVSVLFFGLDCAQNTIVVYFWLRTLLSNIWSCKLCVVHERKTKDCAQSRTLQQKSCHLCLMFVRLHNQSPLWIMQRSKNFWSSLNNKWNSSSLRKTIFLIQFCFRLCFEIVVTSWLVPAIDQRFQYHLVRSLICSEAKC